MAPGTVAHDPHTGGLHTDRSAGSLVQLPGRTCYVNRLPRWRSRSKIGSLDNINHIPGGGERRVFNEKPQWNAHSKVLYRPHLGEGGRGGCSVRNYRLSVIYRLADYTQTQMHIRGGSRVPCRRGRQPSGGTYDFAKVSENLHEFENILGRGWGARRGRPLRSDTAIGT